jgi:enterochelin esterase-like enzyme
MSIIQRKWIKLLILLLRGTDIKNCDNKTVNANSLKPETPVADRYRSELITGIKSNLLNRIVDVEIFLPVTLLPGSQYPLLILNDGQDSEKVGVKNTLENLVAESKIPEIIVAGVHAGDRLQEYGVTLRADYQGRGKKAKNYSRYIISELIPYLMYQYPIKPAPAFHFIAGYSLGGLSALDIGWNHPEVFSKIGVFSGSLWWRKRDRNSRFYSNQRDRLMHLEVRNGKFKPGMKFWFQTGTKDEEEDRDNNGVIDSIDDTLDLIAELTKKGYRPFYDIAYYEMKDGTHDPQTWARAMPNFLTWALGS